MFSFCKDDCHRIFILVIENMSKPPNCHFDTEPAVFSYQNQNQKGFVAMYVFTCKELLTENVDETELF